MAVFTDGSKPSEGTGPSDLNDELHLEDSVRLGLVQEAEIVKRPISHKATKEPKALLLIITHLSLRSTVRS